MKRFHISLCLMLTIFMLNCQSDSVKGAIKLSPKTFKDSINSNDAQVVDVRTPKEFHIDRIENAVNIDYFSKNFTDSISLLNTKKPVFIYCRSGKRSTNSIPMFKKAGFKYVYELEGGFLNWKKESLKSISK